MALSLFSGLAADRVRHLDEVRVHQRRREQHWVARVPRHRLADAAHHRERVLGLHLPARVQVAQLAEVYNHAEEMPDGDDVFWLYSAEDLGVLSENHLEEIFDAIQAASQRARPGTAPRRLG